MTLGNDTTRPRPEDGPPPTHQKLMIAAGVLLVIPIIALLAVPTYAKEDPELFGFPFFFWYQFLWVFLCSGLTYAAYRLTLAARKNNGGDR
ncbi:MAG: DUF3311 domain-containing protein [Nocardioides sp.]|uniref:DUF3311 domain-containing protein n=1 Tax=Nocardioides sp. TaxID=35761 RepID=UPI00326431FA